LAHAAFWTTHGAGFAYARLRAGIMAKGSPEGIWPTEVDISSVRAFTRGQNLALCRGRDWWSDRPNVGPLKDWGLVEGPTEEPDLKHYAPTVASTR
jgi:hypothetical protein